MKFGPVATQAANGAVLAHSLRVHDGILKKGTVLGAVELERLTEAGISEVTAAVLEGGDIGENDAARLIGNRLETHGLTLGPVFTGRVNLLADQPGVIRVDADAVAALNDVDEGLTLATLADYMRVDVGQLVATVKIIPYGLPETLVDQGVEAIGSAPIVLHPFRGGTARLVMTKTPGFKESLLEKGADVVRSRVEALGYTLNTVTITEHAEAAVAEAPVSYTHLTLPTKA